MFVIYALVNNEIEMVYVLRFFPIIVLICFIYNEDSMGVLESSLKLSNEMLKSMPHTIVLLLNKINGIGWDKCMIIWWEKMSENRSQMPFNGQKDVFDKLITNRM